jgi:tetratricopeptide (TPR) repeat protein
MAATEKAKRSASDIYQLLESGIKVLYRGEYEKARRQFEEILAHYPQELEVLARVRAFLRVCDRHLANGNEPLQAGTPEELYNLAGFHHNNGDYDQAVSALEEALKRGGENLHYVHYSLAAAYARQGRRDAAVGSLKTALQLSPEVRYLASQDSDFSALHGLEAFDALLS